MRAYLKEEADSGDEILSETRRARLKEYLASKRFKGLVLASFRQFVDSDKPGHMDIGRLETALRHLQSTLQVECLKQVLLLPTDFHAEDAQQDVRFTTQELAEWLLSIGHDPREHSHLTLGEFHFLAQTMVFTLVTLHRVHSIAARKRSEALRPTMALAAATMLCIGAFYLVQVRRRRSAKPPPIPPALRAKLSLPGSAGSTGGLLPHTSRVLPVFQDSQQSATSSHSTGQGGAPAYGATRSGHDAGYDGEGDDDEAVGGRRPKLQRSEASVEGPLSDLVAPVLADTTPQGGAARDAEWLEQQALSRGGAARSRRGRGGSTGSGLDPSDC